MTTLKIRVLATAVALGLFSSHSGYAQSCPPLAGMHQSVVWYSLLAKRSGTGDNYSRHIFEFRKGRNAAGDHSTLMRVRKDIGNNQYQCIHFPGGGGSLVFELKDSSDITHVFTFDRRGRLQTVLKDGSPTAENEFTLKTGLGGSASTRRLKFHGRAAGVNAETGTLHRGQSDQADARPSPVVAFPRITKKKTDDHYFAITDHGATGYAHIHIKNNGFYAIDYNTVP